MEFTDSVAENAEILTELTRGIPPGARKRAQKAAVTIENVFTGLQQNHPKDIAVALGAAFAVFKLAERLVEAKAQGGSDKNLIQML